jgi:DHA2 family multidrug resistance protein-like MFS transporter
VVGGFVLAAVSAFAFVRWELRVADPMLDLTTLRSPQLSAAVIAMTIAFMAMTGSMYLIQQALQLVKGYTPLASALATSGPIVTMNFLVMPRAPGLTERFGARWMVATGAGLIAVAALVISLTTVSSSYVNLFVGFALMALAFSIFTPASTEAVMTAVPPEKAGGASAINQMTRQLGQALGVALTGSIAASGYRSGFHLPDVAAGAGAKGGDSITGALEAARNLTGAARTALLDAAHEAFLHGVRLALIVAAVLAVAGAVYAALAIPSSVGTEASGEGIDEAVDLIVEL